MDDTMKRRLEELREVYDSAICAVDPVTYAFTQQRLLHAIAEFLIQPLQEHEMAERSKFVPQTRLHTFDEVWPEEHAKHKHETKTQIVLMKIL